MQGNVAKGRQTALSSRPFWRKNAELFGMGVQGCIHVHVLKGIVLYIETHDNTVGEVETTAAAQNTECRRFKSHLGQLFP